MKALATFLVLIGSLIVHGCSVKDAAFGKERTDVSQIQVGSSRGQVGELLDAPIDAFECPRGTRAKYVYDRFSSAEPHLGAAVGSAVFSLFTFGLTERYFYCHERCQRGILEIVFDDDDAVVLLRPLSDAYDVGWYCRSGDTWTYFCKPAQESASKKDPPPLIQVPDDLLIETGCFGHFSGVCQQAHNKDPSRQYDMGTLYRDGRLPVTVSRVKAYVWFSLATQGGGEVLGLVPLAEREREKVAAKMSADEIVKAKRMVLMTRLRL
jgi:hypothetical protein